MNNKMSWYLYDSPTGKALFQFLRRVKGGVKREIYSFFRISRLNGIQIRPSTTDLWTVMETFDGQQYLDLCQGVEPKVIFDLGANIGDSSVFFARRYPNAIIISVECDASNFELLCKNCNPYPNIITIKAAVWGTKKLLSLNIDLNKNAVRVVDNDAFSGRTQQIESVTIPELMAKYGVANIDILKVDIEGGEKNLFSGDCSWLKSILKIGIELHEDPAPGCTTEFFSALVKYFSPFTISIKGETLFVQRRCLADAEEVTTYRC